MVREKITSKLNEIVDPNNENFSMKKLLISVGVLCFGLPLLFLPFSSVTVDPVLSSEEIGYIIEQAEMIKEDDPERSVLYYERAVELGSKKALIVLADLYWTGNGEIKKDQHGALEYYEQACGKGVEKGCLKVAEAYEKGDILSQDMVKAVHFYEKLGVDGELEISPVKVTTTTQYFYFPSDETCKKMEWGDPVDFMFMITEVRSKKVPGKWKAFIDKDIFIFGSSESKELGIFFSGEEQCEMIKRLYPHLNFAKKR